MMTPGAAVGICDTCQAKTTDPVNIGGPCRQEKRDGCKGSYIRFYPGLRPRWSPND